MPDDQKPQQGPQPEAATDPAAMQPGSVPDTVPGQAPPEPQGFWDPPAEEIRKSMSELGPIRPLRKEE